MCGGAGRIRKIYRSSYIESLAMEWALDRRHDHLGAGGSLLLALGVLEQLVRLLLVVDLGQAGDVEELEVLQGRHLGQAGASGSPPWRLEGIAEILILRVVHLPLAFPLGWVHPVLACTWQMTPVRQLQCRTP